MQAWGTAVGTAVGSLDTNDAGARENARITLGLLEAVEAGRARTQRGLAADLGIALGLVNVYLKRCVKKGLVKVSQAPARRLAYYLTPQGLTEKTRLTAEYLSWSLTFFRQAKASCGAVLDEAAARGWRRIVLAGSGDLADIARLCAADRGIEVVAIVDPAAAAGATGVPPTLHSFDTIAGQIDGVLVTAIDGSPAIFEAALRAAGRSRVLAPSVVPALPPGVEQPCITVSVDEVSR
jgi:DNA-binding MarR family transcriptional regulator